MGGARSCRAAPSAQRTPLPGTSGSRYSSISTSGALLHRAAGLDAQPDQQGPQLGQLRLYPRGDGGRLDAGVPAEAPSGTMKGDQKYSRVQDSAINPPPGSLWPHGRGGRRTGPLPGRAVSTKYSPAPQVGRRSSSSSRSRPGRRRRRRYWRGLLGWGVGSGRAPVLVNLPGGMDESQVIRNWNKGQGFKAANKVAWCAIPRRLPARWEIQNVISRIPLLLSPVDKLAQ